MSGTAEVPESWSCRESNPGPPTPLQVFYERSSWIDLGSGPPTNDESWSPAQMSCPVRGSEQTSSGKPARRRRTPRTQAVLGPTAIALVDGDRAFTQRHL